MGRVLLSTFSEDELSAYFEAVRMVAFTDRTVTEESQLRDILNDVRQRGYAIVEEELEIGLRSIAVPVRGASGMPVAALCIGAQVGRADRSQLEQGFLPLLLNTASDLSVLLP
jgi:IclR family pca regulon transcriptional regulator